MIFEADPIMDEPKQQSDYIFVSLIKIIKEKDYKY